MPATSRFPRSPAAAWRLIALAALPMCGAFGAQAADAESDRQYCERQEGVARTVCLRDLEKAAPAAGAKAPAAASGATAAAGGFKVVGGTQVDPNTFKGFQTWRAAACDRCHGANQQGLVGPSLINSLKVLSKEDFVKTVTEGRLEKGMPSFKENPTVMTNLDPLYAYLKGRSDGAITQAHVQRIP
jgi:mono/diheme cytochrome c family protein